MTRITKNPSVGGSLTVTIQSVNFLGNIIVPEFYKYKLQAQKPNGEWIDVSPEIVEHATTTEITIVLGHDDLQLVEGCTKRRRLLVLVYYEENGQTIYNTEDCSFELVEYNIEDGEEIIRPVSEEEAVPISPEVIEYINAYVNAVVPDMVDEAVEEKTVTYVHVQALASYRWIIPHNLNKYPSITTVDNNENIIRGDVTYLSPNVIEVLFTADVSGKAYLN